MGKKYWIVIVVLITLGLFCSSSIAGTLKDEDSTMTVNGSFDDDPIRFGKSVDHVSEQLLEIFYRKVDSEHGNMPPGVIQILRSLDLIR
jgi:hypothetical protein